MLAAPFYQLGTLAAIPIILLMPDEYERQQSIPEPEVRQLASLQFGARCGEVACIFDAKGLLLKVYIGVGDGGDYQALATAVMQLPVGTYHSPQSLSQRAVLMWSLAQYQYDRYQKTRSLPKILAVETPCYDSIVVRAQAIFWVRDLINAPANAMDPEALANETAQLAKRYHADFHQSVGEALLAENYPAIHAVGRAAVSPPRLLELTWGKVSHPHVTLVGKGVCFDSGGLDLKNAAGMRLMKKDMGGAAQVLGLAQWLMAEEVPIFLQVLIPAVENAIGPAAYRPGDVLTMRNGLTVEIDNTDAEGRLILADALVKASEHNPELLIDFATLTGAARVAVGTELSALFCNDDTVAASIMRCGEEAGDPVWRMPLFAGYSHLLESSIADLVNAPASPYAGAITAALFLQNFIGSGIPWVHFDTMAWNVGSKPGKPEGGEAMGLLAVGHYLIERYKPQSG